MTGSFRAALKDRPGIINGSLYSRHIALYRSLFQRNHLKVYLFDELKEDPQKLALEIFAFLGISTSLQVESQTRVRSAREARSPVLATMAKQGAVVARRLGLAKAVGALKNSHITRLLYRTYDDQSKPELTVDEREELIPVFCDDVRRLSDVLEIDLRGWLEPSVRQ